MCIIIIYRIFIYCRFRNCKKYMHSIKNGWKDYDSSIDPVRILADRNTQHMITTYHTTRIIVPYFINRWFMSLKHFFTSSSSKACQTGCQSKTETLLTHGDTFLRPLKFEPLLKVLILMTTDCYGYYPRSPPPIYCSFGEFGIQQINVEGSFLWKGEVTKM